ncbi:MAG: cell division protein FtsA [Pseudomonadota bacterium]
MFGWSDGNPGRIVGLLDIGSEKICCMIVSVPPISRQKRGGDSHPRVLGMAAQRSRGIKAGFVTDADSAETAVAATVARAERAAGLRVEHVLVNVSCGRPEVTAFKASTQLDHGRVDRPAMARLHAAARSFAERQGRIAIKLWKPRYAVDHQPYKTVPLAEHGRELAGEFRAITADDGPVDGLAHLIERCVLSVDAFVPTALASALAVTTAEERRLGVTVVDIGAGCMDYVTLADDAVVACGALPIGASHITSDIARTFGTSLVAAERMKTLHGGLVAAQSDAAATFSFPATDDPDGDTGEATRLELIEVARWRVARQLQALQERITAHDPAWNDPLVFTGGGSNLPGLVQFAANALHRKARLGRPAPVAGMTQTAATGSLATVIGMAATMRSRAHAFDVWPNRSVETTYLRRVQEWVRESF